MIGPSKPVQDLSWADCESIMDNYEISAAVGMFLTAEATLKAIGLLI